MTDPAPDPPLGKREAHRRATRAALEHAAKALFAERGFAETTVRDIAAAAGVNERTFFRYFAGKEELILDDVLAWMPLLQQAIRDRPAGEPPLVAVAEAFKRSLGVADRLGAGNPLHLFRAGRPTDRLGPSAMRFLLRVETDLSRAVLDRLVPDGPATDEQRFEAELVARASLALLRSVLIRATELRDATEAGETDLAELIDRALAVLEAAL